MPNAATPWRSHATCWQGRGRQGPPRGVSQSFEGPLQLTRTRQYLCVEGRRCLRWVTHRSHRWCHQWKPTARAGPGCCPVSLPPSSDACDQPVTREGTWRHGSGSGIDSGSGNGYAPLSLRPPTGYPGQYCGPSNLHASQRASQHGILCQRRLSSPTQTGPPPPASHSTPPRRRTRTPSRRNRTIPSRHPPTHPCPQANSADWVPLSVPRQLTSRRHCQWWGQLWWGWGRQPPLPAVGSAALVPHRRRQPASPPGPPPAPQGPGHEQLGPRLPVHPHPSTQ